jgi:hypothetical protein
VNFRTKPSAAEAAVLLTLVVGGAFSFYQLGSGLFACGKEYAGPEIRYWLALAGFQGLVFMGSALSERLARLYRILQYLTLPLAAIPFAQLAIAYPRIFVVQALLAMGYWYAVFLRRSLGRPGVAGPFPAPLGAILAETTIFLLATLVVHSAIAFLVLHSQGVALDDRRFIAIAAISAVIAAWIVRRDTPTTSLSIVQVPPLALLVVVLLRAKLPDGAYDSLFYKATLPIMIADWRTAITGAMDHTLLGTDFLEIINSQLRILDPDYSAALTGSLAFVGMWLLVPLAAAGLLPRSLGSGYATARNVLALLVVSLSEPLTSSGTAYQEPMIALLLAGAILPMSIAWLFLGAAIAVKATALFVVPLIVVAKCWSLAGPRWPGRAPDTAPRPRFAATAILQELVPPSRSGRVVLGVCVVLAVITVGEQFYRNLAYTGRITGVTEALSTLTDPEGRVMAKPTNDPFEALIPGSYRERYLNTFIHVITLDRWIAPSEFGFHIIPTSRLMAIAAVLAILVLAFARLRRDRMLLLCFATWLLCAFGLLKFVSQGRHLLPLSFGAALVIAYLVGRLVQDASGAAYRKTGSLFCLAIGFVALGDQLVGSFINNGWQCRRNLVTGVVMNDFDRPTTPLERRLAVIAAKYRVTAAQHDVVPTILCENTVDRMRYVGAHYVYAYMSLDLTLRHLAAHPDHVSSLPTSLLAVCFTSPQFPERVLPPDARKEFTEVEGVKTEGAGIVRILVSNPLMAGGRATSLVGRQMNPLALLGKRSAASDLMPLWGPDRLTTNAPADAPGGKGALIMESGGERVGVLISPFSVAFDNVDFDAGRRLKVDVAMPYSNSDGMGVDFRFEGRDGARASVSLAIAPKPEAAPGPRWESKEIAVPPAIRGRGTLTVAATSPSGNLNADWLFFRQLELIETAR